MFEFKVEESKDNYNVVNFKIEDKWKCIGSKYNQNREIEKLINSVESIMQNSNYIIFGLSFGEYIDEFVKKIEYYNNILIVDINKSWIDYLNNNGSLSNILKYKNIKIVSDLDGIMEFLREKITSLNVDNLKILYYGNYDKIFKYNLIEMHKKIQEYKSVLSVRKNTSILNSESWLDVFLNNLKYVIGASSISNLKNRYKNKPAIIVSAGPSLSKNIQYLKEADNALIISGGRTLQSLIDNGINPHCVVVLDSGEVSFKLVQNYIDKINSPLLFSETTNSEIIKIYNGKRIFAFNNSMINNLLGEENTSIICGGSVAHTMTKFAIYMGCNPIVFMGQDLAYTDEKSHATCARDSWEKLSRNDFYKRNDDIYIDDINGNPVRTSIVLNTYRLELEEIINEFPNIKFIDSTEGGALIKGTEVKSLCNTISEFKKENIEDLNLYLCDKYDKSEYIYKLKKCINTLKNIVNKCEKGNLLLDRLEKAYYMNNQNEIDKCILELDKIDKYIKNNINEIELLNRVMFQFMYELKNDHKLQILKTDSKNEVFEKYMLKNKIIYLRLKENIEQNICKVVRIVKELENNKS